MALTKHISLSKPHSSIAPDRSSIQQRILYIADYFLHRWEVSATSVENRFGEES
jgi:hypothetical protein